MNERIQELWDKAEHSVNEVFVWDPTGPDREDVIREKFAELIVKECARQNNRLSLELAGVLEDLKEGVEFDEVCQRTVERVHGDLEGGRSLNEYFGIK